MHIRNPDFGHALITPLSNTIAPNGPGKIVMAQWRSYSQLCGFLRFLQPCWMKLAATRPMFNPNVGFESENCGSNHLKMPSLFGKSTQFILSVPSHDFLDFPSSMRVPWRTFQTPVRVVKQILTQTHPHQKWWERTIDGYINIYIYLFIDIYIYIHIDWLMNIDE